MSRLPRAWQVLLIFLFFNDWLHAALRFASLLELSGRGASNRHLLLLLFLLLFLAINNGVFHDGGVSIGIFTVAFGILGVLR